MLYVAAAAARLLLSKLAYKEASVVHHCKACTCTLGDTVYKHVQQRMVMAVSRTRLL